VAGKLRVLVRDGYSEPLNIFTVTALPPGERKTVVFGHALAPVQVYEREESDRMRPRIAEAASAHRVLENRLKAAEAKAAKEAAPTNHSASRPRRSNWRASWPRTRSRSRHGASATTLHPKSS
jgi:hypothetical protein